jgi:hypothetical protein
MSVRIALFGALVLLLSGCASYDNGYRDGAYYRSSDGGEGDYYYGRPQQRSRGYYDPIYDPFYGPYYGPYRSPLYYPYRYYPHYGPYRPYRSGFGFEYNYGYGGYGYPIFGFGYSHSSGGDRHHDRDHRDRDDHVRDRDRDRNADRDADRERDRGRDQYRRPGSGSAQPWRQVVAPTPGQADFQRNRAPALRMPAGGAPVVQMRRAEPAPDYGKYRGARGGATPVVGSQRQPQADFQRDRAPALRMPAGGAPVVQMRRAEPAPDYGKYRGGRGGAMPVVRSQPQPQADFQRDRAPALRMPAGGAPVVQMRRAEPAPDYGKYRGGRGGATPVVRSQPQTALPRNEKSRNESQKRTSTLEKER